MKKNNKTTAIDLFAGAGGFSTGAAQAGVRVLWAANHWKEAVDAHAQNHPETVHACQDLRQANWTELPAHDILLASPCCQGHSKARGKDSPQHDDSRQTAWAVIDCVAVNRPKAIVVENVPEFQKWELFDLWRTALERYGYKLTFNVLNSADFGVPQARERLFVVGTQTRKIEIESPRMAHRSARSVIEWETGNWSPIRRKGRAPKTLERIANAKKRFGSRCMFAFYGSETGGRDMDKPFGTLTTKDRFALVDGDRMRMLTSREARIIMGFPVDYVLPESRSLALHMLGNAVCPPVARGVIEQVRAGL